ncbi:MAG: PDZ domain-containing protein [Opitutales bacterium]|nr:PDZ domain-containing protein [Opitutales bacterium]
MFKIVTNSFFSLTTVSFFICNFTSSAENIEDNHSLSEVYKAIVRIEVISEEGSSGRMMKSRSTGSGVITRKDGIVITNHHVAGKATRLTCRLYNGEEIMADLVGADAMTDLAVLKLRLEERKNLAANLEVAKFGNSDEVKVGDICYAMGSPAGLSQSITRGIVSNLAMISPFRGSFRLDGENVGELVRWLGHDAIIFPGNSGGPLVDIKGRIIGINEVGIGSLGGAIPSNLAKKIADELTEHGFITRSWTGLECQPVFEEQKKGIIIAGIIKDSPGEKAGFLPGDRIVKYNGHRVDAQIPEDLPLFNQLSSSVKPGEKIKIDGFRNGIKQTWHLSAQHREAAFSKEEELNSWGITVRNFTLMSSLEARRENSDGVQVHSVGRGGPSFSAKPAMMPGDVITMVKGESIRNVKELLDLTRKITRGKNKPVSTLVKFERNLAQYLTVIKIGPEPDENQPLEAWKPWLGISTQVLTKELSNALGLPSSTRGIRVAQVFPDTPALDGGLQAGDLLFRVDGQIITASRPEDAEVFSNMIKQYKTDASISLSGQREGKPLDLNISLTKRPPPSNELPKLKDETFEFSLREISFADRVNARLSDNHAGIIVDNVEPAGWAALSGLRQGDFLLEIEKQPIKSIEQYKEMIEKQINAQKEKIIFFVRRGIHTMYLEVQPDWDKS